MGIDIDHRNRRRSGRRKPRSQNIYILMLAKLYKFLSRKTGSKFNKLIYKRLCTTRINRPPLSLSRLIRINTRAIEMEKRLLNDKKADISKVITCVGTITDDKRILSLPKLRVCALHVTDSARARILKAGGQIMTFDQLAQEYPKGGRGCILVRGPLKGRKVYKHFGLAPGQKNSKTKPYSLSHGNKFDRNWLKRRHHGLTK